MLKIAMIFTDKMVLQREKPIVVWGCAEPGSRVSVTLDGDERSALTDGDGRWQVTLAARDCATSLTMTIKTAEEEIVLHDICVGEVWLAGGQSNMEFHLGFEQHFEQVLQQTQPDTIRFFDYPEVAYEGELEDFDYRDQGFWRGCGAEDLGHYSAVGYYFARSLTEDLQVPIGIIGCNWGGTPACAWMDPDRLTGTDGEIWIWEYEQATAGVDMDAFLVSFKNNPYHDRTNLLTLPYFIKCMKEGFTREEQLESQGQLPDGIEVPSFYFERRPGGYTRPC